VKSRIRDNKMWSRVTRDSDPKMTALIKIHTGPSMHNFTDIVKIRALSELKSLLERQILCVVQT
jgi:hypothetical protein